MDVINRNIPNKKVRSFVKSLFPTLVFRLNMLKNAGFWREYKKQCKNADFLVIGGGNMLMQLSAKSYNMNVFREYIKIAHKNGKPIFVIAVGVGPFATKRAQKLAAECLSLCDYVTFRDEASMALMHKYIAGSENHHITVDPAYLLEKKITRNKQGEIGLNILNTKLIQYSTKQYQTVIEHYILLIKTLKKQFKDRCIILFSTDLNDYPAIYDVMATLDDTSDIEVEEICTEEDIYRLYGRLSVLVASRMHTMIIAYSQNIPIIGLTWQSKVREMFEIINKPDCLFELDDLSQSVSRISNVCAENLENDLFEYKDDELKEYFSINGKILREIIKTLKK